MKEKLGADVELRVGSGGAFEISVDGRELFSKKELKRFPKEGEIVARLQENKSVD